MFDPGTEIGNQPQILARALDKVGVDPVGHGRDEHVAFAHRRPQGIAIERRIIAIECDVEQFAHSLFDMRHEPAGDPDARGSFDTAVDLLFAHARKAWPAWSR